ncbi:MAG TPA: hypothetical protein VMW12_02320 [Candidatus Dormibacteraeota bacterium]|nr:hypothetical protein [Candidatus Dormibacteraeota bacterium]
MSTMTQTKAGTYIDEHGKTIDQLHDKLEAIPDVDKEKLEKVVETYKTAHKKFHDDALGCMN